MIGESMSHVSLRGTYMSKLRHFSSQACADARSVAKRDRDPDATLDETLGRPGHPPSPTVETGRRVTDDDPPARKAVRAISYVVDGESSPAAVVSTARYIIPPTPLLLPLWRFITWDTKPVDGSSAPVSEEVVDRGSGESPLSEFDAEISTITSRISPLHWPEHPDSPADQTLGL